MTDSLAQTLKPVAVTAVGYILLLVTGTIIQLISPVWGALFSIILLLGQFSYMMKLIEASKRFALHEIVPALVTWTMAGLLRQQQDYAFATVSLILLGYRLFELYF